MNKTQTAIRIIAKRYRFESPLVIPVETSDGRPLGDPYVPRTNRRGYPVISVRMRKLKISIQLQVHQLVGYQLYGEAIFEKGLVCRHKDNVKTNFSQENILLGTHLDNYLDNSTETRRQITKNMIEAAKRRQLFSDEQAKFIRQRHASGTTVQILAAEYGVALNTIRYLIKGTTYKTSLYTED